MPRVNYIQRSEGYRFPGNWCHLRGSGSTADQSLTIRDEHWSCPTYRSTVTWQATDDGGVLALSVVVDQTNRTEREVEDEALQSARKVWQCVGKNIRVADTQGKNGQCDLYIAFKLPAIPPTEQVEHFYRLVKGYPVE